MRKENLLFGVIFWVCEKVNEGVVELQDEKMSYEGMQNKLRRMIKIW